MTRSVLQQNVCCIELQLQKGTFLEELKPQTKEAWLSRGERAAGFGLERRSKKKRWDFGQAVPGAAISKLKQASRRGAFQECIQQRERQQALQEKGSGWLQLHLQPSAPGEGSSH